MLNAILTALIGCSTTSSVQPSIDFDVVPYVIQPDIEIYRGKVLYYLGEDATQLRNTADYVAEQWADISQNYVTFEETSNPADAQLIIDCVGGPRVTTHASDINGKFVGSRVFLFTTAREYVYDADIESRPVEVGITPEECRNGTHMYTTLFYMFGHVVGVPDTEETGTVPSGALMSRNIDLDWSGGYLPSEWEEAGLMLFFDSVIHDRRIDESTPDTRRRKSFMTRYVGGKLR